MTHQLTVFVCLSKHRGVLKRVVLVEAMCTVSPDIKFSVASALHWALDQCTKSHNFHAVLAVHIYFSLASRPLFLRAVQLRLPSVQVAEDYENSAPTVTNQIWETSSSLAHYSKFVIAG